MSSAVGPIESSFCPSSPRHKTPYFGAYSQSANTKSSQMDLTRFFVSQFFLVESCKGSELDFSLCEGPCLSGRSAPTRCQTRTASTNWRLPRPRSFRPRGAKAPPRLLSRPRPHRRAPPLGCPVLNQKSAYPDHGPFYQTQRATYSALKDAPCLRRGLFGQGGPVEVRLGAWAGDLHRR